VIQNNPARVGEDRNPEGCGCTGKAASEPFRKNLLTEFKILKSTNKTETNVLPRHFKSGLGQSWDEMTSVNAAFGGYVKVLKWARENICPWNGLRGS